MKYPLLTLSALLLLSTQVPALAADTLATQVLGKWCMNTEEYAGELSVNGSLFEFLADGTYIAKMPTESKDRYTVEGNTLHLDNFGDLQVLSINKDEMKAKAYSTYHFTRNTCLPIVAEAMKLTELNNAIIKKDLATVKSLVADGVKISQPDTRSSQRSTPLMVAIKYGDLETVKYLLSLKPDLAQTNAMGETALDIAKKSDNPDLPALIQAAQ